MKLCRIELNFLIKKTSQNGKITLSFIDIGKRCPSHRFFNVTNMSLNAISENKNVGKSCPSRWQICLLTLFTKISEFTVLINIFPKKQSGLIDYLLPAALAWPDCS